MITLNNINCKKMFSNRENNNLPIINNILHYKMKLSHISFKIIKEF